MKPLDLAHGGRLYDWWGRHRGAYRAATAALVFLGRERNLRRLAAQELGLAKGQTVLDLACGHGVNFALLEGAIGPSGRLIALDYSEEMLAAAKRQVTEAGWENVELRRADAARAELGEASLDAVLCTLGLSAMPRHREAIASVRRALRPGARFAVLDAKPFDGLARPLNPMIKPLFRYTTNWDYERDLAADMREAFGNVGVREFNGGSLFLAVATRSADSASHRPERHDQPFEVHACSGDAARPLGTPFPRPEQRPQMRWT